MSFEIILKNNRAELEILTTRILLAIAGIAAIAYAGERSNYYSGIGFGLLLLLLSFFVKTILNRYKVNRFLLLAVAALLSYITTGYIYFAVILFIEGVFFNMLGKKVKVEVGNKAVVVHTAFSKNQTGWEELKNVVLKDRILTIDFNTNKLLQTEIAEESYHIDESAFNRFCNEQLQNKA
jgi:hypothetical protein